ncbi:MAG: PadR family transcriptional regulator [Bacteroidales bacterium]
MNLENVKSQMRKGMLEYCILLIISKEPAYVSDIIQQLKEAKLIVVEGTLYPLLTRLKNAELLSYYWVESTQGPPRKYFELTEHGVGILNELRESWLEIESAVNHLNETIFTNINTENN